MSWLPTGPYPSAALVGEPTSSSAKPQQADKPKDKQKDKPQEKQPQPQPQEKAAEGAKEKDKGKAKAAATTAAPAKDKKEESTDSAKEEKKAAVEPPSWDKRNRLLALEAAVQAKWAAEKMFEEDAPGEGEPADPKFMATFPYPYMNGRLHLGHSFSMSKVEFAMGYQRLKGKRCLFPFAYHLTGMPIKASADKIKREMELYGNPPVFPAVVEEDAEEKEKEKEKEKAKPTPAGKPGEKPAKAQHSKVAAKTGNETRQWNILKMLGISDEEIPRFADPLYWIKYFPPFATEDLRKLGVKVDWRRSFVTTDVNPFYDSFICWQFWKLKELGKIKFGKRHTIYSVLDGQACMDHDRASGEGVLPQEYTIVKLEVLPPFAGPLAPLAGRRVFLVAATLRPETMYGQTNCWLGPDVEYVAFEARGGDVWVATRRAATNMAYQELTPVDGRVDVLLAAKGAELMGLPLRAPLSAHAVVYTLPMMTVSAAKGTGVVTSVPSDSPDDFTALRDLQQKAAFREKHGVTAEMCGLAVVPIIDVPEYGPTAAVAVVEKLKISSQNDREMLQKAKDLVYLRGFYEGVMLVGEHQGKKVSEAKPLIRRALVAAGDAAAYYEPEGPVVSRSGDDCIVALVDQWYLDYGEETWRAQARKCLDQMDIPHQETRNQFEATLEWLHQWACSRSFGLGTRIPWDEQWLIESLSDSTIYMAYYTVAHLLQGGVLDGSAPGPLGVTAAQMTPAVWDHVFLGAPLAAGATDIAPEKLARLRREFDYWYPLDLRVSGKDLVPNHLTFFIYNHVAIFPESKWPRGVRANGHLLLNSAKMAKSTGNFLSLRDAVDKYTADVTRLGLADAGDSVEDANLVEEAANSLILRIYLLIEWMTEAAAPEFPGRPAGGPETYSHNDLIFDAEINKAIALTDRAYAAQLYREALKTGFYDLQIARDRYRELTQDEGGMHRSLLRRFLEVQTLLLAPVAPHFAEHIWSDVLKQGASVMRARWPEGGPVNEALLAGSRYFDSVLHAFRLAHMSAKAPRKGPKPAGPLARVKIFVADSFPDYQVAAVELLRQHYSEATRTVDRDAVVNAAKQHPAIKKSMQKAMGYVTAVLEAVPARGSDAFKLELPYNEREVLEKNLAYMSRTLKLQQVDILPHTAEPHGATAIPGEPVAFFYD